MSDVLTNINSEVQEVIANKAKSYTQLSYEEITNHLLDAILSFQKNMKNIIDNFLELDKLYSELTWNNDISEQDDDGIKELIEIGKKEHKKTLVYYASCRRELAGSNIGNKELKRLKSALDDFEETVYEVEEIFFDLRKDDEINDLMDSMFA